MEAVSKRRKSNDALFMGLLFWALGTGGLAATLRQRAWSVESKVDTYLAAYARVSRIYGFDILFICMYVYISSVSAFCNLVYPRSKLK